MRDIKFKVWDKQQKVMLDWEHILDRPDLQEFLLFADKEDNFYSPLMQYTGLKDKNGTEIYEGDIYKAKMTILKTDTTTVSIEVVEDIRNDNVYYYDEVEVVGNIYENPELLKEEVK
ncbi:YopX family protein [Piscibacillus sp. B03]|uniref:YopX family protein n=1 Tax=Piscibacillus sp. B03 TaxID=3457430 RepID=UPI003FCCD855